jgi:hypothetical protein
VFTTASHYTLSYARRIQFTFSHPFSLKSILILSSHLQSRDSSVGIALGYGLDDRVQGFDSRRGLGIFLFTTVFRTALEPTQPPIQRVSGDLSLGVKRPWREADHSSPSSAEVKEWMEVYIHSPNTPSWRGAQLKKKKSTGTTLTFFLPSTPVSSEWSLLFRFSDQIFIHLSLPCVLHTPPIQSYFIWLP